MPRFEAAMLVCCKRLLVVHAVVYSSSTCAKRALDHRCVGAQQLTTRYLLAKTVAYASGWVEFLATWRVCFCHLVHFDLIWP